MKKIILIIVATVYSLSSAFADDFKIRLIENEQGYMEVQMKCVNSAKTPTTSLPISGFTFQIRWAASLNADIDIICSGNPYNLADGLNARQTTGSYHWRTYYAGNTPFNCPTNWVTDEWETITSFKVVSGSGSGTFEVAPDGWVPQGLNWQIEDPVIYHHPDMISGITNYSFPTIVYDYVWVGGISSPPFFDGNSWGNAGNWESECGNTKSQAPSNTANCFIPGGLTSYPSNIYTPSANFQGTGNANKVIIGDAGIINIGNTSHTDQLIFTDKLIVNGTLNIMPDGYVTVQGNTEINNATGIVIHATSDGVGSFIDNGTITYGTNGSGKVQTFMKNTASAGNYYMHYVGPTVNKLTGSNSGVTLNDFDLANQGTFAYAWDESVPSANGWVNIYNPTMEIYAGDGIALSTADATDHTIEMTGSLLTGNVTTPSLTYSNNHYELISNPYPSAIDFQQFALAAGNTSVINAKYWVWDPSSGNYKDYSYDGNSAWSGSAGQFIQVGQGFFVQTINAGTVTFANSYRVHDNTPFRDANANALKMKVSGGGHGFADELNIVFTENATYGYDDFDTYKWNSIFEDATMIRSIAEDGSELSINFLPLEGLQGNMVSVPVNFKCGYAADYTFDFEGIDSFEAGNEVWLEDKQDNDQWIILNGNPHYTFTATPDDPNDRFILHFFGPNGVDENTTDRVDIYSWGQYAYIKNVTKEKIKKVSVYDISGHLVTEKRIPEGQKLSKIWVADNMAYYIVQVITDKNVYTNKVLINK